MTHRYLIALAVVLSAAAGCDDEPETQATPETAEPELSEEVVEAEEEAPPAADPNEACAQVIVVAWEGAEYAADDIDRDQAAARAKAEELRTRLEQGADFAELARAESDAASTGPRGGLMGTYARDEWPAPHMAIRDALFGLGVGQLSEVVEAPYGWVLMRRCAVEKIHTRHILIRYQGAKNAPESVTRSKEEAEILAGTIRVAVQAAPESFEEAAREHSEDSSASRGGDMGELGRGRLAEAYEAAAWELAPGGISEPVETEFGYHIIQRVE